MMISSVVTMSGMAVAVDIMAGTATMAAAAGTTTVSAMVTEAITTVQNGGTDDEDAKKFTKKTPTTGAALEWRHAMRRRPAASRASSIAARALTSPRPRRFAPALTRRAPRAAARRAARCQRQQSWTMERQPPSVPRSSNEESYGPTREARERRNQSIKQATSTFKRAPALALSHSLGAEADPATGRREQRGSPQDFDLSIVTNVVEF